MKKHPDWYREQSLIYAARTLPINPRKKHRPNTKRLTPKQKYKEYLKSPRWIAYRAFVINERGSQCDECGAFGAVHVHHLNYERVGRELDIDVQLLCAGCHKRKHGK